MKGVLRCLSLFVLGILLILLSSSAMTLLVRLFGLFFFSPALLSLVRLLASNAYGYGLKGVALLVVDSGSIVFGLLLMFSPGYFEGMFVTMLSVAISLLSLYYLYKFFAARECMEFHWVMYVIPVMLLAVSLLVLAGVVNGVEAVPVFLGVSFLIAGAVDLFLLYKMNRCRKGDSGIADAGNRLRGGGA